MVTELQRQYARSRVLRRAWFSALAGEPITSGRGYKRLWNRIIAETEETRTEAQIIGQLYSFLNCYDITPAERAECLRLLQLSGTALTGDQRRQLQSYLQAE